MAENHSIDLTFDSADEYRPEPPPVPEIPRWKDGSIRIGIHTSIAGDITGALEIAHNLTANALQIFSSSPRMWTLGNSRISEADAARFRARRTELQLGPLVVHGNYLINLASPNPVLRTRSIQAFHQEIIRAAALGADFLVAHPGSALGGDVGIGLNAIAQGLRQASRGLKFGDMRILMENTAGQGSSLGRRFEELQAILGACPDLPMGVCIDTAHLFAAGWDIRTAEGLDTALRDIDRTVGLAQVYVVHVNDSKTALGSRVDRHEHVGKGHIGIEGFRRILHHPSLAGRAFILETPIDKPGDDQKNVSALWKLVKQGSEERPDSARKSRPSKQVKRKSVRKSAVKVGRGKRSIKSKR